MGVHKEEIFLIPCRMTPFMNEYDIKRGHYKNIDGKIGEIVEEVFGSVKEIGGEFKSSFGALKELTTSTVGKTVLKVTAIMDKDVAAEVAAETIKKYNEFLLRCTGYNSKQRAKRLKNKAKKGTL